LEGEGGCDEGVELLANLMEVRETDEKGSGRDAYC
jgi:hypothetical protein